MITIRKYSSVSGLTKIVYDTTDKYSYHPIPNNKGNKNKNRQNIKNIVI